VLIAGACGAGKSSIAALGYRRLTEMFGPTAAIDTDTLFMMIDPLWELPYDDRRGRLMHRQVARLARSFFDFGLDTVLIVGNALHTRDGVEFLVEPLRPRSEVFHVLLDPSLETIRKRISERGDNKTHDWIESHVAWVRQQCDGWTARIDNSVMTVEETARAIRRTIDTGEGRLLPVPSRLD